MLIFCIVVGKLPRVFEFLGKDDERPFRRDIGWRKSIFLGSTSQQEDLRKVACKCALFAILAYACG